jgi:hypothetical protein
MFEGQILACQAAFRERVAFLEQGISLSVGVAVLLSSAITSY